VPGAADLKVGFALILELDFFVVELPREEHAPIGTQQVGFAEIGPPDADVSDDGVAAVASRPFTTVEAFMPIELYIQREW